MKAKMFLKQLNEIQKLLLNYKLNHNQIAMYSFINRFLVVLVACLFLVACGEKMKEAKNTFNNIKNLAESAENIQEELVDQNEKLAERRARGDTVAMHYEELANYLPQEVDGYQPDGDLDGSTTKTPGMGSVSTVSQRYINDDGDRLRVELVDYVGALAMYTSMISVYASGFEVDNSDQHMKGFTIDDDIKGWQVYHKKTKKVELNVGIAGRFMASIEADNQSSVDFAKELVTEEMQVEKLAKM